MRTFCKNHIRHKKRPSTVLQNRAQSSCFHLHQRKCIKNGQLAAHNFRTFSHLSTQAFINHTNKYLRGEYNCYCKLHDEVHSHVLHRLQIRFTDNSSNDLFISIYFRIIEKSAAAVPILSSTHLILSTCRVGANVLIGYLVYGSHQRFTFVATLLLDYTDRRLK